MSQFKDTVHSKAPFSVRMVEFGCRNCGRRWSSANGSLEDYQKCKNCYTECYPVGSRIREPNKLGNENRQTLQGHSKELCGKCARLGRSCMMLNNEKSDNGTDDMDMYKNTVPQAHQPNTREHHQNENRPINESYSLKQWPELTNLALRYLPNSYTPNSLNRIRLSSTVNGFTSAGITAAEVLTDAIHKARKETDQELSESSFYWENLDEEDYEDYCHQDDDTASEVWDYETFIHDSNEEDQSNDELYYNNMFNRLDDGADLGLSVDDNGKETSSDNEEVVASDDTDNLEHCFYQDGQNYSSSQDEEVCFYGIDDMSSDDDLYYKKQMNNRVLRRGRKHTLQGRKNSLKLTD